MTEVVDTIKQLLQCRVGQTSEAVTLVVPMGLWNKIKAISEWRWPTL